MSELDINALDDPFQSVAREQGVDSFQRLMKKPLAAATERSVPISAAVVTARFHGFGLDEQPVLADLPDLPGELVAAQSTVPLLRHQIGSRVVVLFEHGDVYRPIVMGVLQTQRSLPLNPSHSSVEVKADDERYLVSAEREIVLRCGDASITLTRAGKVIIKGKYIVSRSSGYNKIKGAAVDIN